MISSAQIPCSSRGDLRSFRALSGATDPPIVPIKRVFHECKDSHTCAFMHRPTALDARLPRSFTRPWRGISGALGSRSVDCLFVALRGAHGHKRNDTFA
jgi:hypothetical protein